MSLSTTLLLGSIAGVTIVLGLPVGRMTSPAPTLRVVLNAIAVGVLLFLFWDVSTAAWEPLDERLGALHDHSGGLGPVLGYGLLFIGGLSLGLLALVGYDRYLARSGARRSTGPGSGSRALGAATDQPPSTGGGLALTEAPSVVREGAWTAAQRLSLLIAVGIGLHNFAEGLAIGQSAASGEIALATVLVVGFALHNATEGFGIVAPLAAEHAATPDGTDRRPSWGFLALMALIGGGPTFVGTWVGHSTTSEPLSVAFLTLAGGSIAYVVIQLLGVAARARRSDLVAYGVLAGLLAGFVTDAIVTAGGA